eukprot:scaffold321758_cov13-Tisochrysis_lutea.AAC.1
MASSADFMNQVADGIVFFFLFFPAATIHGNKQVVQRDLVGQGGLPPLVSYEVLEPLTDKAQ